MKKPTIDFRPVALSDAEGARWLRWMDAEVFPDDTPFEFKMANWLIGWDGKNGAAYCAWKPLIHGHKMVGFHYRAGVLREYRGHRLQRRMLTLRERDMRRQGAVEAVTYTSPCNAASMSSLIGAGYRPYTATETNDLTHGRKSGFVHWRKEL